MTPERQLERTREPATPVTVMFNRTTLERVTEASRLLGMDVTLYIGLAAVTAAKEDIGRLGSFWRRAGVAG